jgi:hypothetical protein
MAKPKKDEQTATIGPAPGPDGAAVATWEPPRPLGRNAKLVIAGVVLLLNLPMLHYFLVRGQMPATLALPYSDSFEDPSTVERNYWSTGGLWRVVNGQLLSPGVKNNPLWLRASLPNDVAVEFDVRSMSPEGDIKVEIFGDGSDHASGYVLIHGGWNNSISIIARLDEHGPALPTVLAKAGGKDPVEAGVYRADTRVRVEANPFRVEMGRTYRWRIERRGKLLTWFIDGQRFMSFEDPLPLTGKGHDRFGFSSWEAQLFFDNLKVEAL